MQLHAPDAVAIGKQCLAPAGGQAQLTLACSRAAVGPAWPGSSAAGTAADEVRKAKDQRKSGTQGRPPHSHRGEERIHSGSVHQWQSPPHQIVLDVQQRTLQQASALQQAIEALADQLTPEVIRAARADADGRRDLDRIEYALGTIGKALILTDYSIDEEKDIDKSSVLPGIAEQDGFILRNGLPTAEPAGAILHFAP